MRALSRLRDGLVGAWCPSIGGWGGTVLRDLSGQGNHGQLVNMDPPTDWVVSEGRQALDFDGVNDYVEARALAPASITFCAWTRKTGFNSTFPYIVQAIDGTLTNPTGGGGLGYNTDTTQSRFVLVNNAGGTLCDIAATTPTGWYHFAGTWDGALANLYINGTQANSASTSGVRPNNSTKVFIGVLPNATPRYFLGQLDDIRVYNRALSPDEIRLLASERGIGLKPERTRRLVQKVAPPPPPITTKIGTTRRRNKDRLRDGLVGAWCPSVSGWGGNVLRDLSGHGNHGTLNGLIPSAAWRTNRGYLAVNNPSRSGTQGIDVPLSTPQLNQLTLVSCFASTNKNEFVRLITRNDVAEFSLLLYDDSNARFAYFRLGGGAIDLSVSPSSPTDGQLHWLVGSWDGAMMRMFFDGRFIGQTAYSTPLAPSTTKVVFTNRDSGERGLEGDIFDFRIYNRALSDQEVRTLYNGGPGYGLRPERTRRLVKGQTFTAARLRRQSLIGSGVY